MVEPRPVIVQVGDRVQECVSHALHVQRPVGVTHVEAFGDQAGRQKLRAFAVSPDRINKVQFLVPDVGGAGHTGRYHRPGTRLNVVVSQDAKRRNNVLGEVFVLIVAPDDDEIGLKIIDCGADLGHPLQQKLSMRGGGAGALVGPPFQLHGQRPVGGILELRGDCRIL